MVSQYGASQRTRHKLELVFRVNWWTLSGLRAGNSGLWVQTGRSTAHCMLKMEWRYTLALLYALSFGMMLITFRQPDRHLSWGMHFPMRSRHFKRMVAAFKGFPFHSGYFFSTELTALVQGTGCGKRQRFSEERIALRQTLRPHCARVVLLA